jgi:hypothetical protein
MIKIKRDFDDLSKKHFLELKPLFEKRINEMDLVSEKDLNKFLEDNIEKIIISKPEELLKLETEYLKIKSFSQTIKFTKSIKSISYIFDYVFFREAKSFPAYYTTKYNSFILSKLLNINVCPYCNRNFTNTVFKKSGEKITRPDFDHFFSQKDHPILALSFYNLIPSCQICNSRLKGDTEFNLKDYFHPYINGFEDEVSFNYLPNSTLGAYGVQDKFSIFFEEKSHKYSDKLKSSQEVFKYKEIYEYHGDIIEELVAKIYKGSQTYLDSVRASFPGLNISEKEMYRLAYGNYMDEKDHEKRPFAKLTKDIFDKLGPDLIL